ncbi:unnamed protein product [Paramecium sonneborni]|uniref:Transmembrane protein n=1 Tax=Paramecium sonneborni TaxID=65129 RepID=A0A8S1K9X3_9CILI|nr:unnamed protein product [Paramecium sonneborni]
MKMQQNEKKNLLFDKHDEYMIKKFEENSTNQKYYLHVKNKQYILFDTRRFHLYTKFRCGQLFFQERKITKTYEIPIEFNCYYSWKYQMIDSLKQVGKFYENLGMDIYDEIAEDNTKEMLFETNFYLVAVTMIVSELHIVFSTLAIKNDFQYCKNLNSQEGISIRALYTNFVFDVIITLIDMENYKTMKFKLIKVFPQVQLLHQQYYESKTQQYDQKAAIFLYKLSIPLFEGYIIYAMIYQEHKGVYSFIIESLVKFIYLFGFINMTPQLFINYKLKSVAHLPWRTMIYKFLNSIIDYLFAFIITMPWLKRLSCFRDDIIFLIYLYQRSIYKVDPNKLDAGYAQDINTNQELTDIKEKKRLILFSCSFIYFLNKIQQILNQFQKPIININFIFNNQMSGYPQIGLFDSHTINLDSHSIIWILFLMMFILFNKYFKDGLLFSVNLWRLALKHINKINPMQCSIIQKQNALLLQLLIQLQKGSRFSQSKDQINFSPIRPTNTESYEIIKLLIFSSIFNNPKKVYQTEKQQNFNYAVKHM